MPITSSDLKGRPIVSIRTEYVRNRARMQDRLQDIKPNRACGTGKGNNTLVRPSKLSRSSTLRIYSIIWGGRGGVRLLSRDCLSKEVRPQLFKAHSFWYFLLSPYAFTQLQSRFKSFKFGLHDIFVTICLTTFLVFKRFLFTRSTSHI